MILAAAFKARVAKLGSLARSALQPPPPAPGSRPSAPQEGRCPPPGCWCLSQTPCRRASPQRAGAPATHHVCPSPAAACPPRNHSCLSLSRSQDSRHCEGKPQTQARTCPTHLFHLLSAAGQRGRGPLTGGADRHRTSSSVSWAVASLAGFSTSISPCRGKSKDTWSGFSLIPNCTIWKELGVNLAGSHPAGVPALYLSIGALGGLPQVTLGP